MGCCQSNDDTNGVDDNQGIPRRPNGRRDQVRRKIALDDADIVSSRRGEQHSTLGNSEHHACMPIPTSDSPPLSQTDRTHHTSGDGNASHQQNPRRRRRGDDAPTTSRHDTTTGPAAANGGQHSLSAASPAAVEAVDDLASHPGSPVDQPPRATFPSVTLHAVSRSPAASETRRRGHQPKARTDTKPLRSPGRGQSLLDAAGAYLDRVEGAHSLSTSSIPSLPPPVSVGGGATPPSNGSRSLQPTTQQARHVVTLPPPARPTRDASSRQRLPRVGSTRRHASSASFSSSFNSSGAALHRTSSSASSGGSVSRFSSLATFSALPSLSDSSLRRHHQDDGEELLRSNPLSPLRPHDRQQRGPDDEHDE